MRDSRSFQLVKTLVRRPILSGVQPVFDADIVCTELILKITFNLHAAPHISQSLSGIKIAQRLAMSERFPLSQRRPMPCPRRMFLTTKKWSSLDFMNYSKTLGSRDAGSYKKLCLITPQSRFVATFNVLLKTLLWPRCERWNEQARSSAQISVLVSHIQHRQGVEPIASL